MKKQFLKKQDVADTLGVSVGIVNNLIMQGKLEIVEMDSGIKRIKGVSLQKYINGINGQNRSGGASNDFFLKMWLTAIFAFVVHFLVAFNYGSDIYWNGLEHGMRYAIFLGNIGLGTLFFLIMLFSKLNAFLNKLFSRFNGLWIVPFIYFLAVVTPALTYVDFSKTRVTPAIPTNSNSIVTATPTQAVVPSVVSIKKGVTPKVATHNGTRTGNIVDYYSYCEKKNIKVYENELIAYTTKVGKQIYSTKSDIQCYENEYNSYGNNSQPNTTATSTQNTSPKVAFQATETSVKGIFYCYDNKVNTMVSQQSYVKILRESYEYCLQDQNKAKNASTCDNTSCTGKTGKEYTDCIQICYDSAFSECNTKNNLRYSEQSKLDTMRYENCP